MFASLVNIFRVKELRRKILITLGLVFVYRVGCFIPLPGIDVGALSVFFERLASAHKETQTFLTLATLFSGGAFSRMTLFALGVMPYISSSIIMQLLTPVIPSLEKLAKEGRAGYEKINQYSRYLTLVICVIQGFFIASWLESIGRSATVLGGGISEDIIVVNNPGIIFKLVTILTITCGTVFVMWLGEQIQERGIGNGVSLIITASILSRVPEAVQELWILFSPFSPHRRELSMLALVIILIITAISWVTVVLFSQAQRKIPIQYARRVVGRKIYGGQTTFLPIKVDMAGVIAIILASSLLSAVSLFFTFLASKFSGLYVLQLIFSYDSIWYLLFMVVLIIFFMYFYTAMIFNPVELANNLKKTGGFIPGIRAGQNTVDYIDYVVTRIVFIGSIYVCIIAILPTIIGRVFHLSYNIASFMGGTSIMIIVGVLLDTMRNIESQLIVQSYDGFMQKGRLRGRR